MIIDFHTHAFPEKLAARALNTLKVKIDREPNTDGTTDGLISKMNDWGIDFSVICNIATNPRQQENVNTFAIDISKSTDKLIPLGSIHPESDSIESELIRLKNADIKGIKIHPDYMGCELDDPKFDIIFEICASLDMFVLTHAGLDVCSPEHIHATPDMILNVIRRHPNLKLIAAHFGSNMMFDEVLDKLCGNKLWIDTSLAYIEDPDVKVLKAILQNHDPDRILYGSDAPWCPPDENVKFIESFGLGSEINDKIFHINAERLLYE